MIGQVPPKSFLPSSPYGASPAANVLNPSQPAAANPQVPLLPPNFQDPGTMTTPTALSSTATPNSTNPFSGGSGMGRNPLLRGLFGVLLLFLSASVASATTTVTGTLQNLGTGTVGQGAFVRFWLRGCGGNQPRVNGTAVIAPSQGGVFFFDFAANSSGNVSGTLYSTRDVTGLLGGDITCGTSSTSVWYGMQVFVGGKGGPEIPVHALNTATLNISTVTPITTTPVVTAPTGDSTYLRKDAGNSPVTGPLAINNSLTVSGAGTFTGGTTAGKWNSIITVDGVQFTTCDAAVSAAVTQAGSGLALVIVPSTYAGAACTTLPTPNQVQVWYFNNAIDTSTQSGIFWNNTSTTPVYAWFRPQVNFPSPTGNALSIYAIARFTGAIPASSAMDAISPEAQTYGTITSWGAGTAIQGSETVVTVASTGGTIPQATGNVSYVRDIGSTTTNVTNVYGLYAPTMVRSGTETWGTVVGGYFARQTAANTAANNYAVQIFGNSIVSFSGASANEKFTISGDELQNNVLELNNLHAGGHTYDLGESCNVAGGRLSIRDITQTGTPCWSFQSLSTTSSAEAVLSHTNTGIRTYTFPDANIAKVADTGTLTLKKGTGAGNYTSASTTFVAVDGTNLSLTVTIPAGWKLGIQASGSTTTATAAAQDTVGLNDGACSGSTTNLQSIVILPPSANGMEAWSLSDVVTGDGASHTVNLCYLTSNASDSATIANSSASVSPRMVFTLMPSN